MSHTLTFVWRNDKCEESVEKSQQALVTICTQHCIKPILCVDTELPKFVDVLRTARRWASPDGWMGYVNSDCLLVSDPWKSISQRAVHGFRRMNKPSNTIEKDPSMFIIPVEIWDQYLSKIIPDMLLGVPRFGWWITRAAQRVGRYVQLDGLITHEEHPSLFTEEQKQHNVRTYTDWAKHTGHALLCDVPHADCQSTGQCKGSC